MPHSKSKSDNDTSHARSAKAQKADEVQEAGSAKAGVGHPEVPEGGKAAAPLHSKGHPTPMAQPRMAPVPPPSARPRRRPPSRRRS